MHCLSLQVAASAWLYPPLSEKTVGSGDNTTTSFPSLVDVDFANTSSFQASMDTVLHVLCYRDVLVCLVALTWIKELVLTNPGLCIFHLCWVGIFKLLLVPKIMLLSSCRVNLSVSRPKICEKGIAYAFTSNFAFQHLWYSKAHPFPEQETIWAHRLWRWSGYWGQCFRGHLLPSLLPATM